MINLDGTLSRLRLVTSGTSQITVTASWADLLSGAVTPGETNTSITTAATTVIVPAPAASTVRGLKSLFIRNSGGAANTVTLQRFDGTTAYPIRSLTLAAGEVLACDEGNWYYLSAAGYIYTAVSTVLADGDYGDVIVSASGTAWALDYTAVNPVVAPVWGNVTSKPAAVTALTGTNTGDQTTIVGITGTKAQFDTAVTDGNVQWVGDAPTAHTHLLAAGATDVTITAANLNTLDDGANTALHFHDADRARAVHTGTQIAATISDFSTAVAATASVTANTAKVTNATHTGDVTGATALTIAAGAVSLAKMADMATASLIYRKTAGTGVPEVNTLATLKTDLGLTGTNSGDQTITLTGMVTGTGTGSFATTISAGVVTLAMQANLAANSIMGNNTGAGATPIALTATQATAMLNNATTSLKGLVPAPGTALGFFLRDDMTWVAAAGGAAVWGGITGTLSAQTDLQTALNAKAALASPTFTGIPVLPAINLSLQSIATAAGTTTLTNASVYQTIFTGATTQTVVLPDATTLAVGHRLKISNNSTGLVTVNTNGGALYWMIAGTSTDLDLALSDNSTAAGVWEKDYRVGSSASGKSSSFTASLTFAGTDGTTVTFPESGGNIDNMGIASARYQGVGVF